MVSNGHQKESDVDAKEGAMKDFVLSVVLFPTPGDCLNLWKRLGFQSSNMHFPIF